jgi:FkbM family methyltransferase
MGIKFAIDKTDLSVGLPLKRGDFEPHLMKFYMDQLRAGMTFIDVGANIGIYSMLAAKLVGQEGRVLSFEPNSENCRLIMLSAHRNGFRNVTLFPLALGNDVGHVLFSTHIGSNGGLIPDSHLSHDSCVVVPILRLDDLVETRVDCIKMDVEGAEGLVSKGASRLIKKHRPIITSEFSLEMLGRVSGMAGTDYLRYFESKDYNVFLIERSSGRLSAIHDIESFVRNYGEQTRIVDLAFLPK